MPDEKSLLHWSTRYQSSKDTPHRNAANRNVWFWVMKSLFHLWGLSKGGDSTRTETLQNCSYPAPTPWGKKKKNLTCFGFLYLPHGSGRSHLLMLPTWNLRLCMYKNPLLRAHISCSVGSVNHEHLHSATLPEKHPWERIFPALYKQCQGDPCTFWMLSKPGRRAVTTPQGPSDDVLWLQTRLAEPELTLRDNPSKKTSLETQHRQPTPSAPRGAASSEQIKELGAAVGWQELLSHRNYASQASHWWSLCKSPSIYKLSPLKHISHRQVCVPSMRKSCGNFMLVIILNPSTST